MELKALEERIKSLEERVGIREDIEEIKILQRSYGYYYEHGMGKELTDLYADLPDVAVHWLGQGSFIGKDAISKAYEIVEDNFSFPAKLHCIIQMSGIVHVDNDGEIARGRWYGLGFYNLTGNPPFNIGISEYEVEYIKQNGIWKIKMLEHGFIAMGDLAKPDLKALAASMEHMEVYPYTYRNKEFDPAYPSGYIRPFHFKHPVTGNKTEEDRRNSLLKDLKKVESWVKRP